MALLKEAEEEKNYLGCDQVQTIYFGGGTPSLLTQNECDLILDAINKNYTLATNAEITFEANPDDINADQLKGWQMAGINRLSIGIQSFFDEELLWMNRAHHANQSRQSIELCQLSGFSNLSIDLIYGSPLLTDQMWEENLKQALALDIPHLSCYALTVEEKTPLYKMIHAHTASEIDNDKQARQFLLLMQCLRESGYDHYEVSNFAKPGYKSRHNTGYWKGEKYLGLGPSAHSYNGKERRWNIANNHLYCKGIMDHTWQRETETLTPVQSLNEYIMTSLRTSDGLDLRHIEKQWGHDESIQTQKGLQKYLSSGHAFLTNGQVQLSDEGMLMADGIASALFFST